MFVGSTDAAGVHVLAQCLVDLAIDSYLAGDGATISVALLADGGIRVSSDAVTLPVSPGTGLADSLPRTSGMTAHLTAVVSVWTPNPLFRRATRSELYNPEVRGRVLDVTTKALAAYFEANTDELRRVLAQLPQGGR